MKSFSYTIANSDCEVLFLLRNYKDYNVLVQDLLMGSSSRHSFIAATNKTVNWLDRDEQKFLHFYTLTQVFTLSAYITVTLILTTHINYDTNMLDTNCRV